MRFSLLLPALLLAGCTATRVAPPPPPLDLYARTFSEAKPADVRSLIVVLHRGSSDAGSDSYGFARSVSESVPGSAVVALMRPGFSDAEGNRSPGTPPARPSDALSIGRIRTIGRDVAMLKARYPHAATIMIGHATSAAMTADIAGTQGGLLDGMVLVSCPCTFPEWREYMAKRQPRAGFAKPADSLDPLQTAGGIDPRTRAAIVVGGEDEMTPQRFSRTYAEAIALRGIDTDYRVLPDKGHDILSEPEVLAATERLAAALPEKMR